MKKYFILLILTVIFACSCSCIYANDVQDVANVTGNDHVSDYMNDRTTDFGIASGGVDVVDSNPWDAKKIKYEENVTINGVQKTVKREGYYGYLSYDVPENVTIKSSILYANVYSGSAQPSYALGAKFTINGESFANETLFIDQGSIDGEIYELNDYITKVYSDYEMRYDITDKIQSLTGTTVNFTMLSHDLKAEMEKNFDGRIKWLALVTVYDDGDDDEIYYWIRHGQTWMDTPLYIDYATRSLGKTDYFNIDSVLLSSGTTQIDVNGVSCNSLDEGDVCTISGGYYQRHIYNATNLYNASSDTLIKYGPGAGWAGTPSLKLVLTVIKSTPRKENISLNISDVHTVGGFTLNDDVTAVNAHFGANRPGKYLTRLYVDGIKDDEIFLYIPQEGCDFQLVDMNTYGKEYNILNGPKYVNYTIVIYDCGVVADSYTFSSPVKYSPLNVKLISSDVYVKYPDNVTYTVKLTDMANNPLANVSLNVTVNGKTYYPTTDENGTASVNVDLPLGIYNIRCDVSQPEIFNCLGCINTAVVFKNVRLTASDISVKCGENAIYKINVRDDNNNPLGNVSLNVTVDGKVYHIKSDENGVSTLSIALGAGNFLITACVNDPVIYNSSLITNKINVISQAKLTGSDIVMYFGEGSYYKVRLFADDGKPLKGAVVSIKISGKTVKATTDGNGYASYKITLKENTYYVTATYKNLKVSNKIVVKPVLTAKNISKKKSKKIKFTAKLVNTKGKALKNKKITFKFKGKTYKAKTNKKGIATLTLKNLKVGKYSITSTYGKSSIKNTITIKK
ncbi:Ig-like domain-containing protein [Methanobrevibacter thaueri]|uniref:Bacterial Ig-like domain (Group 1) n=1 Tax=Methanobrevibacter thaueri TaxID=190975 RepID=A0A315XJY1_9EURY|nr:DUF3344 domain-containing protein [Methanobrevibacter thaueri]PWB84703.1 bacterial Ig-like domain (group 1) [Methanobrevibacter thaueri]